MVKKDTKPIPESIGNSTEEIVAVNKIIEQKNGIVTDASQELVATTTDTLYNVAGEIWHQLVEKIWAICDINPKHNGEAEKLANGNYVFNITRKGTIAKSDGQIRVIVSQRGLSIQLNPYSHYGEYIFKVIGLDKNWFEAQIQTCTSFLDDESVPENSIFEKEELYNPNGNYADMLAGYGINLDGERENPLPPKTK